MVIQEYPDYNSFIAEISTRLKDLEEKQRMLKERLLLIGENFIEIKEETDKKILEIKKDVEAIKQNTNRLASFLETASKEFSKFARKDDLEILSKQAKMFQPLEFVRKGELEKAKRG
jgi:predicted  nucleic acid-binding Zn-ribbon protein